MSSKIRLTFEEAAELRAEQRYQVGQVEGEARGMARGKAEGRAEGGAKAEPATCGSLPCRLLEKLLGPPAWEQRDLIEETPDVS